MKVIALDIGGTLLSDDNTISSENISSLKKAKELGNKIVLVTAREYSSTKYISNQIGCDYGVFSNGSHLLDINNLKSLKVSLLKKQAVLDIYNYCLKNNLYIHLNQEFCEVSNEMKYFNLKHHMLNETYPDNLKSNCYLINDLYSYILDNDFTKIVIVSEDNMDVHLKNLESILSKYNMSVTEYNKNLYEHIISKTINYIEIGAHNDTKASGLLSLIEILGIPKSEVVVFGDGVNDKEMFLAFDNSVCMANGIDELKSISSYVTKNDNNNSGVSEGISYYLKRR